MLVQPRVDKALRIVDTCGVHNLHGMPGVLGGSSPASWCPGIATAQLVGIAFTVAFAFVGGGVCGWLIRVTGQKRAVYEDGEEFAGVAAPVSIETARRPQEEIHEAAE